MSLSYTPLNVVQVRDPRTNINSTREYAILRSGQSILYKVWTTNSVSSSSIQFTCTPSAGNTIVNRVCRLYLPIRITIIGIPPLGLTLLRADFDGPRQFPIHSALETITCTINGETFAVNIGDIIHPLSHFNTNQKLKDRNYSLSPAYPDQTQQYSQLFQNSRSPLGAYGDCGDEDVTPRGGFPFIIVANPVGDGINPVTAIVDMICCENIMMSPWSWGLRETAGLINCNQVDFNFNFYNQAARRMWSHDGVTAPVINFTSMSVDFNTANVGAFGSGLLSRPAMLFEYIQPDTLQGYSPLIPYTYPYFETIRYTSDFPEVAPGVQLQFPSNSLQLTTVPRRTYVFLRANNNTLLGPQGENYTDSFFSIEKAELQFMNVNGIFATAPQELLYEMAVKNGIDIDFNSWAGRPLHAKSSFNDEINGIGSILAFEYGSDVCLPPEYSAGVNGLFSFQITLLATNRNKIPITPTMYVVNVFEGTFTVTKLGSATKQLGVVSQQDVISASQNPFIDYADVEDVIGSGNFFTSLKDFGSKLLKGLKESKAISKGLRAISAIPSPYTQLAGPASQFVESLGGEDGVVGGKLLSRASRRR